MGSGENTEVENLNNMRKLLHLNLFIAGLVLSTALCAQNFALPTFVDSISWSPAGFSQMTVSKSGRIFIAPGTIMAPNTDQPMYVMNKQRQLMHAVSYKINTIQSDTPDDFFGCGMNGAWSVTQGYFTSNSTVIGRHDSTGAVVDAFLFTGWATSCGLADGGLLLTGIDTNKIVRLDSLGNVLWQYRITPPAGYSLRPQLSVEHPITKEITVKCEMEDVPGNDTTFMGVLRLDSNGILQWCKRYNVSGYSHMFQTVFNGEVYFYRNGADVFAIDINGQPLWTATYWAPGVTYTFENTIIEGYDGNIYLHIVVLQSSGSIDALVTIDKLTGVLLGATRHSGYGYFVYPQYGREGRLSYSYYRLELLNDIGQVTCLPGLATTIYGGVGGAPGYFAHTLQQTVSNSIKVPATFVNYGPMVNSFYHALLCESPLAVEQSAPDETNTDVFVVPGYVRINVHGAEVHDFRFQIFDLLGQEVRSGLISDEVTEISTEGLSTGCYVISVYGANGFLQNKKVVLQ